MLDDPQRLALAAAFLVLSLLLVARRFAPSRMRPGSYLSYLWAFLLAFAVSEFWSFQVAVWVLGVLCFLALREYFTLVDLRLQDRWGVAGAYLAIPFMIYLVQVDWYGFFIVSIPVYAFLVMPVLVTLGGRETEGTVLSIGIIDLGLFLFVYCIGHIAYLALFSTWKAVLLVLCVALSDAAALLVGARRDPHWKKVLASFGVSAPFTVLAAWVLSGWAEIPGRHAVALGILIPVMVCLGRRAMRYIEADLRIGHDRLLPGRGQVCDSLASFLYAAPIAFHYIRYFLT